MQADELHHWYHQQLGSGLLQLEQEQYCKWLPLLESESALQLGGVAAFFQQSSQRQYFVSPELSNPKVTTAAEYAALPFRDNTLNFALLVHALEFCENPLSVLEEIFRVLTPNGKLLLFAFNAWSTWGLSRLLNRKSEYPWKGRFFSPPRLQYLLKKAGYNTIKDKTLCFNLPRNKKKPEKVGVFLESVGQIAMPIFGAVNVFLAEKQVYGMTLDVEYQRQAELIN